MGRIPSSLLLILFLGIHSVCSSDIVQRQKRDWIIETFDIEEEGEGPYPYILGTIKVEKKNVVFELYGQGVDEDPKNVMAMNTKTGEITVYGKVDYEEYHILKMTFEAHDMGTYVVGTRLGVEVLVSDINDNPPVFEKQTYDIDLKESATQGTFVMAVRATDKDNSKTNNGTFDFRIVSVSPEPIDLEFYMTKQITGSGTMEFKGCLDYEKAETYTILVEAKDHGEKVQLSSTCTVIVNIKDGNNYMPVFTGQTGPGTVKEGEENVSILRLQVSDHDAEGTEAWKAKYKIIGDSNNNFEIITDPKTNEGVLYVKKHLNYEKGSQLNLSVTVENEAPYYSCEVRSRSTTGLWDVVTMETGLMTPPLNTHPVTVTVTDLNEPPVFIPQTKDIRVGENIAEGHHLDTFIAKDLDGSGANSFVYMKGEDPADWIKVDSKTGKITTTKTLDRESPFVKDNVYQVKVYAIDNGEPPMTGTATLNIHLIDKNDNVPILDVSIIDMCLSDGASLANITAFDLDEDPYSGPFHFKLLGDVKDKWRLDPTHGYTVNLVKEKTVYAGYHELILEVFDLQGQSAVHNLSILVCNCDSMEATLNCHLHRATGTQTGRRATGIAFIAMVLLLLGLPLLALRLSCKRESEFMKIEPDEGSADRLIIFNTETPGTDCKIYTYTQAEMSLGCKDMAGSAPREKLNSVALKSMNQGYSQRSSFTKSVSTRPRQIDSEYSNSTQHQQQSIDGGQYQSGHSLQWSATINCHNGVTKSSANGMSKNYSTWGGEAYMARYEGLLNKLCKGLYTLQAPGKELRDYDPYPYAEEGDPETTSQLDAISIPEIPFDADMLLYLGPRFNTLASICRPDADTS